MKYYCGIDGGGTKTATLFTDENGNPCASSMTTGSSYMSIGVDATIDLFEHEIEKCVQQAGIRTANVEGVVIGIPCFGENQEIDRKIEQRLRQWFEGGQMYLCNDAEVGWAGSLGLKPGINIVAGTGSIAFGKNGKGESVRCGGWSTFFGDEGSCYWLGRKTVELFAKQMDGRTKRGALYEIIREDFRQKSSVEIINLFEREYAGERRKVAGLQRYLLRAAESGDRFAIELYVQAADELGLLAATVAEKIKLPDEKLGVSLSGGILHAKKYVMNRFMEWIERFGGYYVEAEMTPAEGAVALALDRCRKKC